MFYKKLFSGLLLAGLVFIQAVYAQTPLSADKAFVLTFKSLSASTFELHWQIAQGYHLYKDRFNFELTGGHLAPVDFPQGLARQDAILGNYKIYTDQLSLRLHVQSFNGPKNNTPEKAVLSVTYQGCSDQNFCYPPLKKTFLLPFKTPSEPFFKKDSNIKNIKNFQNASEATGEMVLPNGVVRLLAEKNYGLALFAFLGLGLLLAFTPCVLPMVPILSGIIVGHGRKNLSVRRSFLLSLAYVLGMSLAYALAGVLAAVAGSRLGAFFQMPAVITVFALIFVLLALSLFGLYELQLPAFVRHRLLHLSNRQKAGSYLGVAMMGALSVLIVSPCVTAPLVGVLTFIAQTGDILLGSLALFALGFGMGLPLLVVGVTEGKFLPKSGPWMGFVKSFFGVLLIATALYLLGRVWSGVFVLLSWSAFCLILAAYLGVGAYQPRFSSGWIKLAKGTGLFLCCEGIVLLIGAAMGHTDPLKPLAPLPGVSAYLNPSLIINNNSNNNGDSYLFKTIKTLDAVRQALAQARENHTPVMLDFYADWCVACQEMDREVFADPAVKKALASFRWLRVDVTANDQSSKAVQDYFGVFAPPTLLFFNSQGHEQTALRVIGSVSVKAFLENISRFSF